MSTATNCYCIYLVELGINGFERRNCCNNNNKKLRGELIKICMYLVYFKFYIFKKSTAMLLLDQYLLIVQ